MDCPGEDTLVAWVERDLHASARVELEDHVDGCARCRATIGHLAATGDGGSGGTGELGRYSLVRRLGAGGMGVVWLAHDPELDRRVAIKVLRADAPAAASASDELLRREARVMASLNHPNVVPVYDVATSDGHVFVTMEYVAGTTLRGWLAERPRHWRDVLEACVKAGRGLAAAHAAGIVHRDFKPDNVLCGGERVLVADFGLARITADTARTPAHDLETSSGRVTRTGHRLGTLRYMAPEQLRDGVTDARSDQWSLGVTLYEAIWGTLPFGAPSLDGLLAEVRAARVRPPPPAPRIPTKIRRAILRCLAAEPSARYPSIDALLDDLESELPVAVRRRRFRIAATALGVLAVAAASIGYRELAQARDPERLCASGAAQIDDAWDTARREAVHRAWTATRAPYAEDVWRTVDHALHARASAWQATFQDACVATRVRGTRSEAVLDRQMACLDRRSRELRALAEDLSRPGSLDHAASAVATLEDPRGCGDLGVLASIDAPPSDLAARVTRGSVELELARANAAISLWRFRDARQMLAPLEPRARALGYRPLIADVLFAEGRALGNDGEPVKGIAMLRDALWFAEASHADETAAYVLLTLAYEVGHRELRFDEGAELLHRSEAAVERAGRTPMLLGVLAQRRGDLAIRQGRFGEAAAHYGDAVRILRPVLGDPSAELAHLVEVEANAYEQLGRFDEARTHYEAALRIQQELLGGSHPDVATTLQSLGIVDEAQGRFHDAVSREQRALAIFETALGPRHALVAQAHDELANAYYEDGDDDRALEEREKAVAVATAALGPQHPTTAQYLSNRAILLGHLGKQREAYDTQQRVLAIELAAFGPEHPRVAETQINLGSLLHDLGKDREALVLYRAALATLRRTRDPNHPQIAIVLVNSCLAENALADYRTARSDADAAIAIATGMLQISAWTCDGEALLALGLADQARDAFARAAELARSEPQAVDEDRVELQFALARALWETGEHSQARSLATTARDHLTDDAVRARADRWLATH